MFPSQNAAQNALKMLLLGVIGGVEDVSMLHFVGGKSLVDLGHNVSSLD